MHDADLAASYVAFEIVRRDYWRQVEDERERRYADHLVRLRARRAICAARSEPLPVSILAEGDSWFKYPVPGKIGGIIDYLEDLLGEKASIANLAAAGDEVRNMLGVAERKEIIKRLGAADKPDVLLFSGGGNDFAGDQFLLWLNEMKDGARPEELLKWDRVEYLMGIIKGGYKDLVAIRDALSPGTKLFFHGYDFAQPMNKGVCRKGPWLWPSLTFQKILDRDLQYEIIKVFLKHFEDMLLSVAGESRKTNIFYINTQGTLDRNLGWDNEIHPTPDGFERMAGLFREALRVHWPHL